MTIDEIIEQLDVLLNSKKRLIKVWNYLFPEELISADTFKVSKQEEKNLKTDFVDLIKEEMENINEVDTIRRIYYFLTGEKISRNDIDIEGELVYSYDTM